MLCKPTGSTTTTPVQAKVIQIPPPASQDASSDEGDDNDENIPPVAGSTCSVNVDESSSPSTPSPTSTTLPTPSPSSRGDGLGCARRIQVQDIPTDDPPLSESHPPGSPLKSSLSYDPNPQNSLEKTQVAPSPTALVYACIQLHIIHLYINLLHHRLVPSARHTRIPHDISRTSATSQAYNLG